MVLFARSNSGRESSTSYRGRAHGLTRVAAAAILTSAWALAACGSTEEATPQPTTEAVTSTVAPVASASTNPQPTGIQAVRAAYEALLSNPVATLAAARAEYVPTGNESFSYAIGEFTGDNRPEMLVRAGAFSDNPVFVVSTAADNSLLITPTILHQGINEVGASLQIRFSAAHDFIYQLTGSGTGSATTGQTGQAEALALEGADLTSVGVYDYALSTTASAGADNSRAASALPGVPAAEAKAPSAATPAEDIGRDFMDFAWFSASDRSGLDALEAVSRSRIPAGSPGRVSDDGRGPSASSEAVASSTSPQEDNVFSGTLVSMSAEQIDGEYLPEGVDPQERFLLLQLDSPVTIEADSGATTSVIAAQYVVLAGDFWSLEGRHITVTAARSDTVLPSDGNVPATVAHVLNPSVVAD